MTCNCSRRSFLGSLGGLVSAAWLPRFTFAAPPENFPGNRDVLVCIFMRGGADGMNIVVPFGDDHYYDNRPTIAIPQPGGDNGALQLDGFFGLHPSLAPLKELYDDGVLAPLHAVGSPDDTRSHFEAMDYMERGTPGQKTVDTGWIGRHLATFTPETDSPFRAVGMGAILQASLHGPVSATALSSIANFHLNGRSQEIEAFQKSLSALYAGKSWLDLQGLSTFSAFEVLQQADPLKYSPQNGAQYPDSEFGLALQQVGQLIRAEVGMEVACVDIGGWDTHEGEGSDIAALLADLGAGLQAFYQDMGEKMQRITVVTMSEFGRRLKENASGGTDHGHGNCMFVLGAGINGGSVYSSWPGLAPEQLNGPGDLEVTTDFRTVLGEIVSRRLLSPDVNQVFPGFGGGYLGFCKEA